MKLGSLGAYLEPDSCLKTFRRLAWGLVTIKVNMSGIIDEIAKIVDKEYLRPTSYMHKYKK